MMRLLLVFLFIVSCNAPLEPTITSTDGSGGTEVVGNEIQDNKRPGAGDVDSSQVFGNNSTIATQTYLPVFKTYNEVKAQDYRIIFIHPSKELHLKEIHFKGMNVSGTSDASLFDGYTAYFRKYPPSEQTVVSFSFDRPESITEFEIYFGIQLPGAKPDSFKIEANIDGSFVNIFEAIYQNDSRANFYSHGVATKFVLNRDICPLHQTMNNLGKCVAKLALCSDFTSTMTSMGYKPCQVKRDGIEAYCIAMTNIESCDNFKDNLCNALNAHIEFDNQMFEVIFNGSTLGMKQCPKP